MHWVWRVALALVSGITYQTVWMLAEPLAGSWQLGLAGLGWVKGVPLPWWVRAAIIATADHIPVLLVTFTVYAILTSWRPRAHACPETLCRKCGHILRGLTRPQCPECGEVI